MREPWGTWIPVLKVADARKSADFYGKVLDFEVDWEHRFADGFPLYISVSRPPLSLHLSEHHGGGTERGTFFVRVPDVDRVYSDLIARGFQPDSEPTDQEYGMRDFGITDPDQHHLTLGSPAGFPTDRHRSPDTDG